MGLIQLRGSDQEGEAAAGREQAASSWKDGVEALDCAESDCGCGRAGVGFGAGSNYIDIGQCNCAADFAEKRGLLLIRFDKSDFEVRGPDLDGETWEAGARAEIEKVGKLCGVTLRWTAGGGCPYVRCGGFRLMDSSFGMTITQREEVAGSEEGFGEVAGDDFSPVADGREVDARVPLKQ